MHKLKANFYQSWGKRVFDLTFSSLGLIIFSPVLLLVAILVKFSSPGQVFFVSKRMGRDGKPFGLFKFRTMRSNIAEESKQFTPGDTSRVTFIGSILRKSKIDELPGLLNVIKGDMSLVGPRPEAPKYKEYFINKFAKVLSVRPGVTDYASIMFRNEEEILAESSNPDKTYIDKILPLKLNLNLKYVDEISLSKDFSIILATLFAVFKCMKNASVDDNLMRNHND